MGLHAPRRLQFSEIGTSSNTTPSAEKLADVAQPEVKPLIHNQNSQMGKHLSYISPVVHNGKMAVTIAEDDIKEQEDYWRTARIGYVLGANPFEKSMDSYLLFGDLSQSLEFFIMTRVIPYQV